MRRRCYGLLLGLCSRLGGGLVSRCCRRFCARLGLGRRLVLHLGRCWRHRFAGAAVRFGCAGGRRLWRAGLGLGGCGWTCRGRACHGARGGGAVCSGPGDGCRLRAPGRYRVACGQQCQACACERCNRQGQHQHGCGSVARRADLCLQGGMGGSHIGCVRDRLQRLGPDLAPVPAIAQQAGYGYGDQPQRNAQAQSHGFGQSRAQAKPPDQRGCRDGCQVFGSLAPQAVQAAPGQGQQGGRHIPAGQAAVQGIEALELGQVKVARARVQAAGIELGQQAAVLLFRRSALPGLVLQTVLHGIGRGCKGSCNGGRQGAGIRARRLVQHGLLALVSASRGERRGGGVRSGRHGCNCVMALRAGRRQIPNKKPAPGRFFGDGRGALRPGARAERWHGIRQSRCARHRAFRTSRQRPRRLRRAGRCGFRRCSGSGAFCRLR